MKTIYKSFLTVLFFTIFQYAFPQQIGKKLTLNDELFTQAYDSSKITKIPGFFSTSDLGKKRYLRIEIKNHQMLRGYLMAYSKYGLFIANAENTQISYCDYQQINRIFFGRSYGNWVVISSLGAGALTTVITIQEGITAFIYGIGAAIGTATYGQLGTALVYGVYKGVNRCHWNIWYKRSEGLEVSEFIDENISKFGYIQNVTSLLNTPKSIVSKKDTTADVNNEITNPNPIVSPPIVKVEPPKRVTYLEGLSFEGTNGINIEWMIQNFQSKSVNETDLMKSFRNIKGLQISPEQLTKLNNSSLQFLAIIISESAGYDIKALLELTDKQKKEIVFYEPGIIDTVTNKSTIKKTYLSDLDLQNLQVIFNELKNR